MALCLAGLLTILTPAASAQSTVNVTIQGYAFSPNSITVVIGVNNTVTWTNNDAVTHTVTSDNKTFSGDVRPGNTFTFTFTAAGVFPYHCSIHAFMTGEVIVLNGASNASSTSASVSSSSSTSSSSTSSTNVSQSSTTLTPTTSTISTATQPSTSSTGASTAVTSPALTATSTGASAGGTTGFPLLEVGAVVVILVVVVGYFLARRSVKARGP